MAARVLLRRVLGFTPARGQQVRRLNVHEFQSMEVLNKFGVNVPRGKPARSASEAEQVARSLGGSDFVVKAQVLAGGRGLGTFQPSGFEGGVHICSSPEEVGQVAEKMVGQRLVTKQSGAEGKPCNVVFVVERLYLRRETYFAIMMDRSAGGPLMIGSSRGGVSIEDVAMRTPEKIYKQPVDIYQGVSLDMTRSMAQKMGFAGERLDSAAEVMRRLYTTFIRTDCTLLEVNPFAETVDGRVMVCDAKLNFDDNAAYRQKDLFALRDDSQADPREVAAAKFDLNYIGLDGSIGCMVNGAGLAMATMDIIKLHGGSPANFLDVGGGATERQVMEAFKILQQDPKVEAILVNIFGGIMRCDIIALGIIKSAAQLGLTKPLVVRLKGTNVTEAQKLISESGLRMIFTEDLEDAARKAVQMTKILEMARQAKLDISFDM